MRLRRRRREPVAVVNVTASLRPACNLCHAPATKFMALPPWPGTNYAHTAYACDDHETSLHGHAWHRVNDGAWVDDGPPVSSCAFCSGAYGACGCPKQAIAANYLRWEETNRVFGDVR